MSVTASMLVLISHRGDVHASIEAHVEVERCFKVVTLLITSVPMKNDII